MLKWLHKKKVSPNRASLQTLAQEYRREGFVRVNNLIPHSEVSRFRQRAEEVLQDSSRLLRDDDLFSQVVNVWPEDEVLRELTLHRSLLQIASALADHPLRIWHDQLLVKKPGRSAPTEPHQDQPYWPFRRNREALTAWIALADVPVERGCMTFFPRSHHWSDLPEQDLTDPESLYSICPELRWSERVTVPLRAGDCTFHHGRCVHLAHANRTPEPRLALAVIFIDSETTYSGDPHPLGDSLGLNPGDTIEGAIFPRLEDLLAGRRRTSEEP